MPLRSVLGFAVIAATAAAPVLAQAGADHDVRCVLVGNAFGAGEKDPLRKQLALATALFYAGRVDARVPAAQFKALVVAQGKALTAATAPAVMTACAKEFQAKERAMRAIGQEVARAAQPAAATPAPVIAKPATPR